MDCEWKIGSTKLRSMFGRFQPEKRVCIPPNSEACLAVIAEMEEKFSRHFSYLRAALPSPTVVANETKSQEERRDTWENRSMASHFRPIFVV